jgi:hypothetical protein
MALIGLRYESEDGTVLCEGIQEFVPDESAWNCLIRFLCNHSRTDSLPSTKSMYPSFKFLYTTTQEVPINMGHDDLLPPGACMLIVVWQRLENLEQMLEEEKELLKRVRLQ